MFHVIIPARYAASRLPGKPLRLIGDRPLLEWVWQCARSSGAATVCVATDDERIRRAVEQFGGECVMTLTSHESGTDRIAEVVRLRQFAPTDIVVNLQGDEPAMPAAVIASVAHALANDAHLDMASAVAPIESLQEFLNPNCVKALRAADGKALYFSRAPVPWPRDTATGAPQDYAGAWRHIGLYAYRVRSLLKFAAWPKSPLESIEKLEQLRALENGMSIHLVALQSSPPAGVDTPEDLARMQALLG